jgi:hypothetical protein
MQRARTFREDAGRDSLDSVLTWKRIHDNFEFGNVARLLRFNPVMMHDDYTTVLLPLSSILLSVIVVVVSVVDAGAP